MSYMSILREYMVFYLHIKAILCATSLLCVACTYCRYMYYIPKTMGRESPKLPAGLLPWTPNEDRNRSCVQQVQPQYVE